MFSIIIIGGKIKLSILKGKMSTFGLYRLDWLMVSRRFPWNDRYETVYR